MGSREPRERVEQEHDVYVLLGEPFCALERKLRDLNLCVGRGLGRRHVDWHVNRSLPIDYFFRPRAEQDYDRHDVSARGRSCEILKQPRRAASRRRCDQASLALADRRKQVCHPRAELGHLGHKLEALPGADRRQVLECRPRRVQLFHRNAVDGIDPVQRGVLLGPPGRVRRANELVAPPQVEPSHLGP